MTILNSNYIIALIHYMKMKILCVVVCLHPFALNKKRIFCLQSIVESFVFDDLLVKTPFNISMCDIIAIWKSNTINGSCQTYIKHILLMFVTLPENEPTPTSNSLSFSNIQQTFLVLLSSTNTQKTLDCICLHDSITCKVGDCGLKVHLYESDDIWNEKLVLCRCFDE